ncbi:MAG: glycosyltransferase family 4 protein [Gemmatimonadales bacterium]|nr:glycosyltransferase family 4 protein [Gemmatimonadales bacterium]
MTYVLREVRALRALGADVHVVALRPPDRPLDRLTPEEREEAERCTYLVPRPWALYLRAHAACLAASPGRYLGALRAMLRTPRPDSREMAKAFRYFLDGVVAGWLFRRAGATAFHAQFASAFALAARRALGVPYSFTVHGPEEFDDPVGWRMREKVAGATRVVTISDYARSQVLRFSDPADAPKVVVARLGVDVARFVPPAAEPAPAPVEILNVGRLVPAKAQEGLVRAVAALVAEGHDVRLRLVGDGPDRAHLERLARALAPAERIVFDGWRTGDEILARFAAAHILAMPSFAEGIPVALMEAMAMAKPCVASRVHGIPELIVDGESGLLVSPSSHEELVAALRRVVTDPALRARLGAAGREAVVTRYELTTNTRRFAELLLGDAPVREDR